MSDRSKQGSRRQFKKTLDAEDGRRRRSAVGDTLRKSKREESLLKRRMMINSNDASNAAGAAGAGVDPAGVSLPKLDSGDTAATLVAQVDSGVLEQMLPAVVSFRKMLSIDLDPPISEVIKLGMVPRFVQLLSRDDCTDLQFEAAWCLTNVASGTKEHTAAVLHAPNALTEMVRLLHSPEETVRDQCVWALGNIAGDGARERDLVLGAGAMDGFLAQFYDGAGIGIIRNTTWALSNLCRGKPRPDVAVVAKALPALASLLSYPDEEVVADAAWALSYITDGDNSRIEPVTQTPGVVPRLVELLGHPQLKVQTPALRAVGNIVTGTESQTESVVSCNPFPAFIQLLQSKKRGIRKETCWALSNITAGTDSQARTALMSGILPIVGNLLQEDSYDVKKEATWLVSNATCCLSAKEDVRAMGSPELLDGLIDMCANPTADCAIIKVALEAIKHLLEAGVDDNGTNVFADYLEGNNGLEAIETLQDAESVDVYELAVEILEGFFDVEADDDVLVAASGVENASSQVSGAQAAGAKWAGASATQPAQIAAMAGTGFGDAGGFSF